MSARSKGARSELEAQKELEAQGYIVYKPQKTSRFGSQDIWNKFDLAGIRESDIKFVQVKTNTTAGFLKVLKEWNKKYRFSDVSFELWVRIDYTHKAERWKIYKGD